MTIYEAIGQQYHKWRDSQPLVPEHDRRLWQKLRLEWNYHSNHIEGNTLTYGETELLLIHGATHGNHTIREYEEMKAHDVGISHLRELAEDRGRLIGEADIRNLNKIILKEPFWKSAQTEDGKPSRKQIIPGEYKTTPNNVITATGELFEFAAPFDVPAKMQSLVQWLGHALSTESPPILPIVAKLHHDFVLIHPFDDGNGRVARMLVNYVLMRQGFPPIIVPTERKRDYLNALRLADAGDITELEVFLGTCVVRSLELGIRAAKDESLDEPGDVEKEIALFIRSQEHHKEKVQPRSTSAIQRLYEVGFRDFITKFMEKMNTFGPLFVKVAVRAEPSARDADNDVLRTFEFHLSKGFKGHSQFMLRFIFEGFRGLAEHPFNLSRTVGISFGDFEYTISIEGKEVTKKLYSEPVLSDESEKIIEASLRDLLEVIKRKSKVEST